MKKNIFILLYSLVTCFVGFSGVACANNDPVPGIDIIVRRDPIDNPITVGACQKAGLLVLKNNAGQWRCVSVHFARTSSHYTKHNPKLKFKAGADLSKKVN